MLKRPCAEPGCPTLGTTTRCPKHTRQRDQARGTRQQRGYDIEHDKLRAAIQGLIDAGCTQYCWRHDCRAKLTGRDWHLGHDDNDRTITRGPECIPCNLKHAGANTPRP